MKTRRKYREEVGTFMSLNKKFMVLVGFLFHG